jgi:hypothetical protein
MTVLKLRASDAIRSSLKWDPSGGIAQIFGNSFPSKICNKRGLMTHNQGGSVVG